MAFKKGQSGNPAGPKVDKPWANALRLALSENDWSALRGLADVVVARALAGDMLATKEIGDRLDGRAKQQTEVTGAEGEPLSIIIRDLRAERDASSRK